MGCYFGDRFDSVWTISVGELEEHQNLCACSSYQQMSPTNIATIPKNTFDNAAKRSKIKWTAQKVGQHNLMLKKRKRSPKGSVRIY